MTRLNHQQLTRLSGRIDHCECSYAAAPHTREHTDMEDMKQDSVVRQYIQRF
jgi:hypothetical protein